MITLKPKEKPKTRKVMMLWDQELFDDAKKYADKNNISVSELSRLAINAVLDSARDS